MQKSKIQIILKLVLGIILFIVLGFLLLIGFYVYMIYGIHPSDEESGGLACEYDNNLNVTKAETHIIKDGKRVITPADPSLCKYDPSDFQ